MTPADPATTTDSRLPLYLDCDTGVDDALALAYLAATPAVDLLGVGSVSGNVDAATGARNTLDLLALLGRSRPVLAGLGLLAALATSVAPVHKDSGLTYVLVVPLVSVCAAAVVLQLPKFGGILELAIDSSVGGLVYAAIALIINAAGVRDVAQRLLARRRQGATA